MTEPKFVILLQVPASLADFTWPMLPPSCCLSYRLQHPLSFMNLFLTAPTHGDLFLWWTHNIYLTTYFSLSCCVVLLHYYLTRVSPRLDSKPFEAQQFFSAASGIMNEQISRPLPVFCSPAVSLVVLSVTSLCPTLV